jgi:two-component system cell cycle sensor histidine kinase/response regulator CckA
MFDPFPPLSRDRRWKRGHGVFAGPAPGIGATMMHSGATPMVEAAQARRRDGEKMPAAEWRRAAETVWGPLVTLGAIILIDQLARHGMPVLYPFPVLLFAVVVSSYLGGLRTGLVSAVLTVLYGVHFFAEPGMPLRYRATGGWSLLVVGLVAPGIAVLVSRLRERAERGHKAALTRAEAEALDRRVSFLSHASATLAASPDYHVTLRDLARSVVPTLGDWCAIHSVDERGDSRFIAGAHRDPARDLAVRLLCEYGDRRLPFGAPPAGGLRPAETTEEIIRLHAQDDEHLKLYHGLKPASVLRVPLEADGRLAGLITLAMGQEYGRTFSEQHIGYAGELGDRVALAIGAGHWHHQAREAERRYRLLFDANPQPMWVFDVKTLEFLGVNDAAIRRYGYSREEFLAMTIMDLHPPDDGPSLPMTTNPGRKQDTAFTRHQRKDGTVMDVEVISHELESDGRRARLVLATDISDRARTRAALDQSQEQLRHAQRLDAVGRLADGVAHDFNNILTTIRGFGDILFQQLPEGDPRRADADQIRKAADRGVLLTGQLQAFSRRRVPNPQPVDLHRAIHSMEALFRRLLGEDIGLELGLRARQAMVRVDPAHLDQLLVNIILNARDAMPGGGTLTIETAERRIGTGARARRVRPGTYILLAISDTGGGMDGEAPNPLFGSLQSADPREQRAGLGLSIVYGTVRQNGGLVRVSSEPGEGTTVKVYLPLAEPEDTESEAKARLHGTETVLVVEDEDAVRELLRQLLSDHGYVVLTAPRGRDALQLAERHEGSIDLVVTDVVMPEMGGGELVRRLTAMRPDLKVLYISGYPDDEVVRRGVEGTGTSFLHKPFTADGLMRRVRDVLAADAPAAT